MFTLRSRVWGKGIGLVLLGLSGVLRASIPDPVEFSNRRELFVDDFIVQQVSGLEYRLGTPIDQGPVLKLDRPWEGRWGAYVSVVNTGTKFQMYYRGGFGAKGNRNLTCYAESGDGLHWNRPNLGLHAVNASTDNNVILAPGEPTWATENFVVLYDPRSDVPAQERYKALGGGAGNIPAYKESGLVRGLYRFASADGIHWRRLPGIPLFTHYALDSQNVLAWLPAEHCYAIYLRTWTGDREGVKFNYGSTRTIARSTSVDFEHWTEPVRMTFDQGAIENLYTNATQPYFRAPQILIAMPFRYMPARRVLDEATLRRFDIDKTMWQGVSDAVLLTSRGGTHYQRKFLESFVRPGIDPASWAARSNMPALGVIPTSPTEMSFFIVRGYSSNQTRIDRMALRLDGFASLHAGFSPGTAITRPLILNGGRISLNLSTSAAGSAKVVLTDENGADLPGFGEADALPIIGDAIDLSAGWKGSPALAGLRGRPVRVKFELQDADLYSFAVLDR
jgi:hypothetical protein